MNEASLVSNAETYFASSLLQVVNFMNKRDSLPIAQQIPQKHKKFNRL
ncbi:competence protein comM [Actinobacillus equuli]|nr:competence protein comM [Actinobacillus equuli]